jgi:hypothetical protein
VDESPEDDAKISGSRSSRRKRLESRGTALRRDDTRNKGGITLGPLSLHAATAALDMENVEQLRVELDPI